MTTKFGVPEIYNAYLGTWRRAQNSPWTPRKNFEGFEKTPDGIICRRLELFFNKFPQISPPEYFKAPYEIYKDETFFPLSFYTTQRAIVIYTAVQKQKKDQLPDTDDQIADIKKSLKYIGLECFNNKLTLQQYCKKVQGYTYKPIVDYTNKLINIYVLIKLPFFEKQLNSLSPQDRELYLKDAYKDIAKYKMRLNASTRAKVLIDKGLDIITKTTNNTIHT